MGALEQKRGPNENPKTEKGPHEDPCCNSDNVWFENVKYVHLKGQEKSSHSQ